MKLAVIDLDGVVADNTKRFEAAATKREFYRQHLGDAMPDALTNPINHAYVQKAFDDLLETLYWQVAFNPDLVKLDTLIDGVKEVLDAIRYAYDYELVFLTSRPDNMARKTVHWLWEQNILFYIDSKEALIMKPSASHFTKTLTWKVGKVQELCQFCSVDELLFIDDEEKHREAVMDAFLETTIEVIVASSLADALEKLKEDE